MTKHNELITIAGIFTIIAFSFFVYRVHITKITDNLTYLWIFLVLIAQILLFIYGRINHIFIIYVQALILFSGILYILYIKSIYTDANRIEKELKQKGIIKE